MRTKGAAYYHGTDTEISVGETIVPGVDIGRDNWAGMDNNWAVWMTPSPELAARYGANVYEVLPIGEVTDWCEENGWDRTPLNDEYVTGAAQVLRRIEMSAR